MTSLPHLPGDQNPLPMSSQLATATASLKSAGSRSKLPVELNYLYPVFKPARQFSLSLHPEYFYSVSWCLHVLCTCYMKHTPLCFGLFWSEWNHDIVICYTRYMCICCIYYGTQITLYSSCESVMYNEIYLLIHWLESFIREYCLRIFCDNFNKIIGEWLKSVDPKLLMFIIMIVKIALIALPALVVLVALIYCSFKWWWLLVV